MSLTCHHSSVRYHAWTRPSQRYKRRLIFPISIFNYLFTYSSSTTEKDCRASNLLTSMWSRSSSNWSLSICCNILVSLLFFPFIKYLSLFSFMTNEIYPKCERYEFIHSLIETRLFTLRTMATILDSTGSFKGNGCRILISLCFIISRIFFNSFLTPNLHSDFLCFIFIYQQSDTKRTYECHLLFEDLEYRGTSPYQLILWVSLKDNRGARAEVRGVESKQERHNAYLLWYIKYIDIAPTFAELAKANIPSFVDGKSILPFLGHRNKSEQVVNSFRPVSCLAVFYLLIVFFSPDCIEFILLEHWGLAAGGYQNNTWQGLRIHNATCDMIS